MAPRTQARTLEGKVAIITGASRGIGEATAIALASRGSNVVLTYSSDSSKKAAAEIIARIKSDFNTGAIGVQADSASVDSPKKIVEATLQAFGPNIDILVNNAATLIEKTLPEATVEDFEQTISLNVRAPLLLLQAVLPHLRRPGRVINLSSIAARQALPKAGIYAASKGAIEALTRNWASELGHDGTTVNVVSPGPTQTVMLEQVNPAMIEGVKQGTAVENRVGLPEDVARVIAFLAEPESGWISGQTISTSGGFHMY